MADKNNKPDKKRFKLNSKENVGLAGAKLIVDKETGVQYLFFHDGYAGGLTVLVDQDGKPLVQKK